MRRYDASETAPRDRLAHAAYYRPREHAPLSLRQTRTGARDRWPNPNRPPPVPTRSSSPLGAFGEAQNTHEKISSCTTRTTRLAELLHREHAALADFLVALADFDRERRWLELGYTSLFYFLHRELGLSKGAAFYRKTAAELIQRYPEVVEPLRDGRLCLTSVVELAKVLTPENRGEVVARFFHASKRRPRRSPPSCGRLRRYRTGRWSPSIARRCRRG